MEQASLTPVNQEALPLTAADPIQVDQEKMDGGVRDLVRVLAERNPSFGKKVRTDRRQFASVLAEVMPKIPGREADEKKLYRLIGDVVQSLPGIATMPMVQANISIATTRMVPDSLPEPFGLAAIGSFDGVDGIMRQCLVPPVDELPSLDHMAVAAGLVVIAQLVPQQINQFSDLRQFGQEGGGGNVYSARNTDKSPGYDAAANMFPQVSQQPATSASSPMPFIPLLLSPWLIGYQPITSVPPNLRHKVWARLGIDPDAAAQDDTWKNEQWFQDTQRQEQALQDTRFFNRQQDEEQAYFDEQEWEEKRWEKKHFFHENLILATAYAAQQNAVRRAYALEQKQSNDAVQQQTFVAKAENFTENTPGFGAVTPAAIAAANQKAIFAANSFLALHATDAFVENKIAEFGSAAHAETVAAHATANNQTSASLSQTADNAAVHGAGIQAAAPATEPDHATGAFKVEATAASAAQNANGDLQGQAVLPETKLQNGEPADVEAAQTEETNDRVVRGVFSEAVFDRDRREEANEKTATVEKQAEQTQADGEERREERTEQRRETRTREQTNEEAFERRDERREARDEGQPERSERTERSEAERLEEPRELGRENREDKREPEQRRERGDQPREPEQRDAAERRDEHLASHDFESRDERRAEGPREDGKTDRQNEREAGRENRADKSEPEQKREREDRPLESDQSGAREQRDEHLAAHGFESREERRPERTREDEKTDRQSERLQNQEPERDTVLETRRQVKDEIKKELQEETQGRRQDSEKTEPRTSARAEDRREQTRDNGEKAKDFFDNLVEDLAGKEHRQQDEKQANAGKNEPEQKTRDAERREEKPETAPRHGEDPPIEGAYDALEKTHEAVKEGRTDPAETRPDQGEQQPDQRQPLEARTEQGDAASQQRDADADAPTQPVRPSEHRILDETPSPMGNQIREVVQAETPVPEESTRKSLLTDTAMRVLVENDVVPSQAQSPLTTAEKPAAAGVASSLPPARRAQGAEAGRPKMQKKPGKTQAQRAAPPAAAVAKQKKLLPKPKMGGEPSD